MKKILFTFFIAYTLVIQADSSVESFVKNVLTTVFDYDSRAYLALAREKEAKRRARFEAIKQRLMQEDMEVALMGSTTGFNIFRVITHFFMLLFQNNPLGQLLFKNNTPLGSLGVCFMLGWSGYRLYGRAQTWYQNRPFKPAVQEPPVQRVLLDNCKKSIKDYTDL